MNDYSRTFHQTYHMKYEGLPEYEAGSVPGEFQMAYEPSYSVTGLNWFNIANQARKRMTENAHNLERWRGERRTFYSALRMMKAEEIQFMD